MEAERVWILDSRNLAVRQTAFSLVKLEHSTVHIRLWLPDSSVTETTHQCHSSSVLRVSLSAVLRTHQLRSQLRLAYSLKY